MKNEEDATSSLENDASVNMREEASAVFKGMRNTMCQMCSLQTVEFQKLEKLQALKYGEWAREFMEFMLTDFLYNMRYSRDGENSKHNLIFADNTKAKWCGFVV